MTACIDAVYSLGTERELLEGRTVDDIEYPDGFIDACDLVYSIEGPIYKTRETLGCWVFSSTELLFTSGPRAVVIATGELVHLHISSLIYAEEQQDIPFAKELEAIIGRSAGEMHESLFSEDDDCPAYPTPNRYWS